VHGAGPAAQIDAYNRAFTAIAMIMVTVAVVALALPAQRDRQ
jgi:hypothetical protein